MIEQTTLHNILTWVIAVVLFIFQSLNYFIAWIRKYVKYGQRTTTVVTADTTISSESILNNKNVPENVITAQGLIRKHFDIPLIIAEDEPKVYNFIKSAQLLTSNESFKEKTKIDQFMENLVDDSYVARGLGLITATVGRQSEFYLYSKYDNNFENVVIRLNGRNGEIGQITILSKNPANIVEPKSIPMDYIYDKDRIKVTYTPFAEGVYTLTLVRNSLSICRSPYYISVEKSPTNSRSQIRLGTKKYKPVTKFAKAKHSSLETCDNSTPIIQPNKLSICKNILPESEKNSIRTDVMSIVTKFESNSIHFQKRVQKSTSSISEIGSETNMINEIPKYSNIPPKIETNDVHDTYVSDFNSPSIHSKTKFTDKNFWNDVDITYKKSKASDINNIDFESERIKKPMTKLNEHVGITNDIPEVKNVPSTRLQPTNSVLEESLKTENLHDVEKHNQTFKTIKLIDESKLIEKLLDPTTKIKDFESKCIDNEPCIQNEVSCFDDEDRKTVVIMDSNEIESNPNDTAIQQITDSAQYNINTPFASVITKITNSICEKCSVQVLKIISEFPRDINIIHKKNSNEMRSSFETLLAQPISININIDNMFEQPISATNEHDSEKLLTISSTKIKHIGTIDKDIKCSYLNEIEPIDNNSDELCSNINNISKELMIKQNKHSNKIDETIKDEIFDYFTVPFAEHTMDKHNTVRKNNDLSTNEIMKLKYSTTNGDNVLHSNQFNNNTIPKSDNKMEIQRQHLQKSSEHSIDLTKTNQFHKNINKELNHISKESDEPLDTSDLVTINFDKNTNCELVTDEFKINNVMIPDENTNIQSSVINNIVLATKEVILATTKNKSEDNEEETNNISYKNVALTSIQNEKQKLMIEKSIEPVLTSFKKKMVEQITQLYLNRDLSNTDNTSTFETHDKQLTNNSHEIQINNNANNTEINTKCIETLTSQLKNHIDKNEISEIILEQKKTDNNHLPKYVENIIKTKINSSGLYEHTLGEIKLQTLVNTAMNHAYDQQIDNECKNMIIDNDIQNNKLKKIDNDKIVQDIEAMLVETPSVTIIKNTDNQKLPKNEVTVTAQCKIPLINDFDTIEIENISTDSKQEMQKINANENDTIVETNAVEIKALQNFQKSHNTEIITPIIELQPTLETRIMNTSELVTVEENSSKEIKTTIEIIDSINIPKETDAVENIDDKNEYESVKLQFKENIIKIPHLVKKENLNEVVENTSTNTSTKSNSIESILIQAEIESPGSTKVCSANDVTIERDIIYKLPLPADNIVIDKPNSQSIPTLNAQVLKNEAIVTIGINTSDPQFSNTAITVLTPSKIPLMENNSSIPKLRILSTVNKLDAIKILTIPKYSATCDTKITKRELQNTSEPTLSPNKLYMKNIKLEKIENIDETRVPTDTEIETLDLNKSGKIKSIPPISHDTLSETTVESKKEKNTLHKTLNPKCMGTTLEPTVNEINCNNTKNETTIPISTSAGVVVEKPIEKHTKIESTQSIYPQSEPNKKVDEMLLCTEAETPTVIDTSTASLVCKIVIEFVTNKNKTPIETLEIIVHEQTEEDIVTVRETTPTMNSLVAVMDEQVNIKNDGTKIRKSIGQNNAEKNIEKESLVPINTLTGVVMENPKMNIVTVTAIESCTNSSTETIDVKTNVEKVIEEESPTPIDSLGELVQENINMNKNTENETYLPIELTIESIEESNLVVDRTEIEIISYTESSPEIIDIQFQAEKIVDEALINSLGETMGENTNMNIVSESKKLLPIVSTKESLLEPTVEEDISVTTITSCTDFSTLTVDDQTDVEKVIEEESTAPNNSLNEVVILNIDTENETLIQIDKITVSVEEKKEKDGLVQIILPMTLAMESIKEPKVIEDITETEITSCTKSSTKIIQYEDPAEKMFYQEAPPVPINFSEEEVDGKSKVIIDTETETHLPIVSTIESIEKSKLVEGIKATKIPYCTESSTEITDPQIDPDNVILESSLTPINFSSEIVGVKTQVNINTEREALLPMTNYVEEKKVIEETSEIVLPIESAMELIQKPKLEEGIIEIKIRSCTDSSSVAIQKDIKHVIDEESSTPNNSLGKVVEINTNDNIDKENEILLPIDSMTRSMEEKKEKDEHIDPLLTMESRKEQKKHEDITVTEITSYTNSSSVILEIQMDEEKVIEQVPPILINSSSKIIGEKTKVNMDTEYETILLIESTIESISEPEINEDTTQTKILSCTAPSNATVNVQTYVEKVIEEGSTAPINCSDEEVGGKSNVNIHTVNETLLPIQFTKETIAIPKTVEDIIDAKISSCTESCILTVDAQKDKEKGLDETINSSGKVVAEKTNMDIDTRKEKILPIKTSASSVEDRKAIEGTTEIVLPIESTMEFKKGQKLVEDITVTDIAPCTDSSSEIVETKKDVKKVIDEVSMAQIKCFDEEVGEKLKVNNGTKNGTVLRIKTSTSSVEDRKAIEGTTENVLPIESTIEFEEESKVVEDINVTEISPRTDSCILPVDAQIDVEKDLDEVTPVLFISSGKIIVEKTKVNMDVEYETILPIAATIESIEEPNVVEDITETEITSCAVPSTENMMDVQTNNEKCLAKKCIAPINSSDEELGGKSKSNNDTEDETLLPIVSTKESIEEKKIESTVVTETEILSCKESSTIIINYQNHTEKIIDEVPINYLTEVMGENINVNIVTEKKTHLQIGSTIEAVEEPNVVEDITEIEKRSSIELSSIILDTKIYVEKEIEEVPSVLIDPKVVGENPKMNMDTEYETILQIESTIESIAESEIYDDITETEILSCTDSSTGNVVAQTEAEKVIGEVSLTLINSSDKVVGEKMNVNIDNENETLLPMDTSTGYVNEKKEIYELIENLLPIESTVESIEVPKVEDIAEPEITSYTESSTEMIDNQNHTEKIIDKKHPVLINSADEVVGGNIDVNIDTETEKLLTIGSTMESIEVSKEVEDIKETEKIPSTNSFTVTKDIHTDVETIIDKESPSLINSFGDLVQENINMKINTENETYLPIELTIEFIEESNLVDDRTEIEITSYTEPLTKIINPQLHAEKIVDKVKMYSLDEVTAENTNLKIVTESETLLSIGSTKKTMVEPKVEEDITITTKTSCADSSTLIVDAQIDVEKVIEEESLSQIKSLGEVVQGTTNVSINTKNETLLQIDTSTGSVEEIKEIEELIETLIPIKSNMESIKDSKKVEDINETEKISFTDSPILTKDIQTDVDIVIEKKSPTQINFLVNILGENPKVNKDTENEIIIPIELTEELTVEPIVEAYKTEIAITPCTDSSTVTVDVQTDVEKVIEEVSPALIHSLGEVVGESTKLYIDTENETLLQIDASITAVKAVIEEKIIENEYSTPTFSPFLDAEKQMNVIIDSKTETLLPMGTNTTFVDEPNVVGHVSENEHAAYINSSITSIKQQIKVDTETENETFLSIENTSFKEQMDEVDKIIQNNLLVDFSAATELKGYEILTDTETSTSIDTLNTTVDTQTVKENFKEIESRIRTVTSTAFEEEQKSVEHITVKENVLSIGTSTASVEEEIQVEEVIENECATLISYSTIHDVASLEEPKVIKNDPTTMRSSVTVVEEQTEVAAAEVVIENCKESLDKTMIEKGTRHNETPTSIDILVTAAEKQTDLEKVTENKIPILVNTSTKSVEKQIKTEKVTENETITLIACEALHKIEKNEVEAESENETSTPVNNSASITIKQTGAEDVTETTFQNDQIIYRNTKTNLIGTENKTENSDNPNNCYLKFGESSKMHRLENEDKLQRKSYGIQKLEMSVQRMKTSDEDYYEKTFVQLEQTEKISKVDKLNVDGENKTIIDDKLYTVNESDLNAIVCASSLEEALTLLDSKIKFKFKHKKSSSKLNSVEYIPKIQTSDSNSSGENTNFTDARKFFKEIEKKSKK